jgi:hypothetical protein
MQGAIMIRQSHRLAIVAASSAMFAVTGVSDAMAQKKLSYEQAMAKCREETAGIRQAEIANSVTRYTQISGCMMKYGHRAKK